MPDTKGDKKSKMVATGLFKQVETEEERRFPSIKDITQWRFKSRLSIWMSAHEVDLKSVKHMF